MASPPGRVRAVIPRVAILGRPNVGKSTLFNALVGKRRAITHSTPGVTRDPVEETCVLGGLRVSLIDTGGYTGGGGQSGSLDRVVSERSLESARVSDLVLLVVDASDVTTEDEDFMTRLRPLSEKLLLVVNKVDTPDKDALVWNAHAHGFPRVFGISSAHGRNLPELKELIASLLQERTSREPHPPKEGDAESSRSSARGAVRIAILGKPNTGKSSLANRLTGSEGSIVSPSPGTTRDVVAGRFEYKGRQFEVLDTAGIRRKSRVTDSVEYYSVNRAIQSIERADVVFLMIDAAQGLADQDKKIAAQAINAGRGIVLTLSRWDLLRKTPGLLAEVSDRVRFQFPVLGFAPIAAVSSVTGYGITSLLDTALGLWQQLNRRVGTGRLNQALEEWVTRYKLPVRGKNYKIRYAAQTGANPLRFVVFVNKLRGFPRSYLSYLENCIRRDLGFPAVPLSIELRQSARAAPGARHET